MRKLAVCVVLLLVGTAAGAIAQTTEGSIRGYVRDAQGGALPGVTLTVSSPTITTPKVAVSDAEGFYRLLNILPAEYTLTAELQGFARFARPNLVVHAGLNLGVDVTMSIGAVSETITVSADSPLIDTKQAVQAVSVTGEVVQSLPLGPQKHWSEFIRFSPGAVSRDATNNQAPVFYVHGSGIVSSSTLIDGADMTSAINPWLGYSALPSDTVADVQLKTSGLDAAAPLGMGLAANVVTKSGTNVFKGSGTFSYSPKSAIANNVPGGTASSASLVQPEASAGGPLVANKAWFFGSYRYRGGFIGVNRPGDQVVDMAVLDPAFHSFDNDIRANILFVKGSARIGTAHEFSTFYNRDSTPYFSDGTFDTGQFVKTVIGGHGYSARLTSAWSNWLTSRLSFSWNDKGAITSMVNPSAISRPVYRTDIPSSGQLVGVTQRATLGNVASATASPYTKWTITGDTTLYRTGWGGSHEFQAGLFLQPHMTREDTITYANNGFNLEELVYRDANNPAAGTIAFHRRVYDAGAGLLAKGHFADNALYVQDAWRVGERLTISPGVRFDKVTRYDDLFVSQLQNSWEVGPRVGMNLMLTKDGRNAVRASFMRIHDPPNINAQSASGAGTQGSGAQTIGYRDLFDTALNGSFSAVFVTPAASSQNPSLNFDPGYHQPYVNEWAVGYRHQFAGQTSLDVGFMNREYKDRTAQVEQNAIYNGNVFVGYRNPALNQIYTVTNNQWNWPVYKALEIVATKQTSRLQLVASFTRVFPHLAGTWQPNDPASFIQPGAFALDRGLGSNDNRSASPNNGLDTATTPGSIEWTEQVGRASAVYHAPWDFLLSASYTFQKGRWSGPILNRLGAADPQFGPTTVALSNGREVANPLATTIRFAGATRSDGQFMLPVLQYINMRVGREFKMQRYRYGVNLDLFNVPNLGSYQGFLTGGNQLFSTNYGLGGEVQPPRALQLELRFIF